MKYIYNTVIVALFMSLLFPQSLSNREIESLKNEIKSSVDKNIPKVSPGVESDIIKAINIPLKEMEDANDKFFGYNYFNRSINFYDNIPTPIDYKLGPGDEIIISMWGDTNVRKTVTINKEGLIFYPNIGFINISNKTLKEAESILTSKLAAIYSTLKDENNKTQLTIDLNKIKSINVYFTGEIKLPGISLIHPFSDIFSAIIQAGGIDNRGSLRTVQLIRDSKVINSYDFYSFFLDGKNTFVNKKISEGDVIHIPPVVKRVGISGAVKRQGHFELIGQESLDSLIKFAGGLRPTASSSVLIDQITPSSNRSSDDNARSSISVDLNSKQSIILNNGDQVAVRSIGGVESKVEIFGRVKTPGKYSAINATLKDILDIAGGFDDPTFRKTISEEIIVLRQDENKFYSLEIKVSYADAASLKMQVQDKVFVYEDINFSNNFTYRVEGEINKPGTYPFKGENITLGEALSIAGGLTELGSESTLMIRQEFTSIDANGNVVTDSETVNNVTLDFEIGVNSVIIATPFENVVRIQGNVYSPGLVTFQSEERLPEYIQHAGGYKPDTLKGKVYIKRANGSIERTSRFSLVGKKIYAGDTIVVPLDLNPTKFNTAEFTADILSVLANLVAILAIADNKN